MTGVEQNVGLDRYTTIGTGGPARLFARPQSLEELQVLLEDAAVQGVAVVPLGLGSNLLVADGGVDALVLRLSGALAAVRVEGTQLVVGGGATNATCLHHARRAGLGGLEFAAAIPGTVGGGVRMNAGAYGGAFADVLVEATLASAEGVRTLTAAELELGYRRSALAAGEVVTAARLELRPSDPAALKAAAAELLAWRKASQPTNRRTFGSVFKNPATGPGAGALIEQAGLKGYRNGGACISPRHANFIENTGEATTADVLALMVEARRRVHEQFGVTLEHEVRLLGGIELPPL